MSVFIYAHFFTMSLAQNLDITLQQSLPNLDKFSELIDLEWIQKCLDETGKASIRKRKLPAEHVIWLVIGLALFRNQPIWFVVQQLQLVFGSVGECAPSASVQARQRLGFEPLKTLFQTLNEAWFKESRSVHETFHGLKICAVDGIVWSMPDTPENFEHFRSTQGKTTKVTWPQARATCLINVNTHEILDAEIGEGYKGELTLAKELNIPNDSVTLFDRAYFSADFLLHWQSAATNSHWLMRARDNLNYEIIKTNAKQDYLIRMPISPRAQKLNPELGRYWEARLIEVDVGGRSRRYITSLLDSKLYPFKDLAVLYIQRWEIELSYRELKSDLQEGMKLRSKQPELIYQELWGVLIAYNLLRRQMKCMAQSLKISPLRISFHIASIAIINILRHTPLESAGNLPKYLQKLFEQSAMFVLPEKRKRSYPRIVKSNGKKYPSKASQKLN